MTKTWRMLAEALGIATEAGWDSVAKKRNMQRYGTMDRRDKQGPMAYFNTRGTGAAQRQASAAGAQPNMQGRPGGLQIPFGADKPSQGNPLMSPTKASPLSTAANSPQQPQQPDMGGSTDHGDEDWLDMLGGDDEENPAPQSRR